MLWLRFPFKNRNHHVSFGWNSNGFSKILNSSKFRIDHTLCDLPVPNLHPAVYSHLITLSSFSKLHPFWPWFLECSNPFPVSGSSHAPFCLPGMICSDWSTFTLLDSPYLSEYPKWWSSWATELGFELRELSMTTVLFGCTHYLLLPHSILFNITTINKHLPELCGYYTSIL